MTKPLRRPSIESPYWQIRSVPDDLHRETDTTLNLSHVQRVLLERKKQELHERYNLNSDQTP